MFKLTALILIAAIPLLVVGVVSASWYGATYDHEGQIEETRHGLLKTEECSDGACVDFDHVNAKDGLPLALLSFLMIAVCVAVLLSTHRKRQGAHGVGGRHTAAAVATVVFAVLLLVLLFSHRDELDRWIPGGSPGIAFYLHLAGIGCALLGALLSLAAARRTFGHDELQAIASQFGGPPGDER